MLDLAGEHFLCTVWVVGLFRISTRAAHPTSPLRAAAKNAVAKDRKVLSSRFQAGCRRSGAILCALAKRPTFAREMITVQ